MPVHSFTNIEAWAQSARALAMSPHLPEVIPGVDMRAPFSLPSLVAVQNAFLQRYSTIEDVPPEVEDNYVKFLGEATNFYSGGQWTTFEDFFSFERDTRDFELGLYIPGSKHRGMTVADNIVERLFKDPISFLVDTGSGDPYPTAEEIEAGDTAKYYNNTIPVSAVIIRNSAGDVLTVRKRGTTSFMFPGGKPEAGEDNKDAAIRECQEEIGITFSAEELQFYDVINVPAANEPELKILAWTYAALPVIDQDITPAAEIEEIRWIDPTGDTKAQSAPYQVAPLLYVERLGLSLPHNQELL